MGWNALVPFKPGKQHVESYSGGIVSSAIDGINCALAAARSLSGADSVNDSEIDTGSATGSSAGFKTGSGADTEAAGEVGE